MGYDLLVDMPRRGKKHTLRHYESITTPKRGGLRVILKGSGYLVHNLS